MELLTGILWQDTLNLYPMVIESVHIVEEVIQYDKVIINSFSAENLRQVSNRCVISIIFEIILDGIWG